MNRAIPGEILLACIIPIESALRFVSVGRDISGGVEMVFWKCPEVSFAFDVSRCKGLILLETYSALNDADMISKLPPFLKIDCEVTGNPDYSMFNLSLVEDWSNSDKYCNDFKGE